MLIVKYRSFFRKNETEITSTGKTKCDIINFRIN